MALERVTDLEKKRARVPARIPVQEISEGEVIKLDTERKMLTDNVRSLAITKTGYLRLGYVRRSGISHALRTRRANQSPEVTALADRAMHRQHRVFWRLMNKGKHRNVAVTACARELVGFIWALLHPQLGVMAN